MGQAVGALSVAALTQRLQARRTQQVAELLGEATKMVERAMRKGNAAAPAN
ncbi:hypothetical protein D3C87_2200710 [compost metagenome]